MAECDGKELHKYEKIASIGEGTFSHVYKATLRSDQTQMFAIKRYKYVWREEGIDEGVLFECSFLKSQHHPNLVRAMEVILSGSGDKTKIYLVMELMPSDLETHLYAVSKSTSISSSIFSPDDCKRYMQQLMSALFFCHGQNVVHRDIKPANIFIDSASKTLKLGDFSISRRFHAEVRSYTVGVTSLRYKAPELLLGDRHYLPAIDLWGAACVFAELGNPGMVLFKGNSEIDQIFSIFRGMGTPTEDIWPGVTSLPYWQRSFPKHPVPTHWPSFPFFDDQAYSLFDKLLKYDPKRRITAEQALEHPYLH